MKVVGINGSPRENGNTKILINEVFSELQKEGIKTELINFAGKKIEGCKACKQCFKNKDKSCINNSDDFNEIFQKTIDADGLIIGSPTYFANVTAEIKAFIDRAGYVSMANGHLYKRKVATAVVAVRRGGAVAVFDAINRFLLIAQCIVPSSFYWNFGFGRNIGEVSEDEEGMRTMKVLGENMSWLMKKIYK
ncbi:MAG: flavodoxin family protein [Candidatus Marinimicrobia bacterium]|nr:flavodoxin family protein [Candidatus Neomarinimicrobiota bacterium]